MFNQLAPQPPPVPPATSLQPARVRRPINWRGFIPKSLSARLVTGVVALVLVLVTVVGTATYYSLKPFLQDRLNQQLSGLAGNSKAINSYIAPANGFAPTGGPVDVWVAELHNDGTVYSSLQGVTTVHSLTIDPSDAVDLAAHPAKQRTMTTDEGVELVVQAVRVTFTDRDGFPAGTGIVVVGLSTSGVHDTLHRLIVLEFLLGVVGVLFAALLTSWGVRVGLKPLKRVTRTAREVTAELKPDGTGLERRVPGPADDTEVGQVASSVNRLLETVQTEFNARVASEERMRQFLADASHELRTPLTSIRGYAELSRLTNPETTDDDPIRRIEIEGTRMSRLVEDLLVLARGDQDSLTEHEPVSIDTVLADAAGVVQAAHPEREITVGPPTGAVVIGDHDQLVRVLVNLLNNAAVHTAPGGPIRLDSIIGHVDTGPATAIRVIDAGPGLAPAEAAHVFERFWRADKARSRVKGGSGLGMAIVAQIVDAHHGQVRFDSSPEFGTTVTVTLPLASAVAANGNPVQDLDPARQT